MLLLLLLLLLLLFVVVVVDSPVDSPVVVVVVVVVVALKTVAVSQPSPPICLKYLRTYAIVYASVVFSFLSRPIDYAR